MYSSAVSRVGWQIHKFLGSPTAGLTRNLRICRGSRIESAVDPPRIFYQQSHAQPRSMT